MPNQFTLKNACKLKNKITSLSLILGHALASFEIQSLLTQIPIDEIIHLIGHSKSYFIMHIWIMY